MKIVIDTPDGLAKLVYPLLVPILKRELGYIAWSKLTFRSLSVERGVESGVDLTSLFLRSTKVFSTRVAQDITTIKYKKYKRVLIWPNSINGDSTCLAPNCIKIKKLATNTKKAHLLKGLNCIPLDLLTSVIGSNYNIRIAENIAITPNRFRGIDLNIS